MNTITLKDVPPGLHRDLKARAQEHGRSLNREIIATLERALRSEPVDVETVLRQAREAREAAGLYVTAADMESLKNKGRPGKDFVRPA